MSLFLQMKPLKFMTVPSLTFSEAFLECFLFISLYFSLLSLYSESCCSTSKHALILKYIRSKIYKFRAATLFFCSISLTTSIVSRS